MSGTEQEFGRREEGPFVDAQLLQQITPANLHLLEIAFDLAKADEPTPNAWSFVQMMMDASLFFYPSDSLLESLRELAVEVEAGADERLYPYEFQVTPTNWHSLDEQPSSQVLVACLAGEDICDRAWLLGRLQTLLATFEQTHIEGSATQFQTLITVGRAALRWRPDQVTQERPQAWSDDPVGCAMSVYMGISLVVAFALGLMGFFALDIFWFPFIAIMLGLLWFVIHRLRRSD